MTYDKMRQDYERMRDIEKARIVDEWKAANGYNDLLAAYSASVAESDRSAERLRAVRKLLEWNGCECECEHHWEDHDDDCDRCLACRIGEAVGK